MGEDGDRCIDSMKMALAGRGWSVVDGLKRRSASASSRTRLPVAARTKCSRQSARFENVDWTRNCTEVVEVVQRGQRGLALRDASCMIDRNVGSSCP